MRMVAKDEYAVVLDFLPLGKIGERRSEPIAQVIGEKFFNLLEVGVREGIEVKVGEKVYIGPEKREKIRYIKRKITYDELTNLAKKNLKVVLEELVKEELIVNFFNKSVPLSARFHMMELLPGIGKKILKNILEERRKEPFKSIEDIKKRIPGIPEPKRIVIERIIDELKRKDKHRLFVGTAMFI